MEVGVTEATEAKEATEEVGATEVAATPSTKLATVAVVAMPGLLSSSSSAGLVARLVFARAALVTRPTSAVAAGLVRALKLVVGHAVAILGCRAS